MNVPVPTRAYLPHFLDDLALDARTRLAVLEQALAYANGAVVEPVLRGKQLALCFNKPSLRTRVSFTVATRRLGGDVIEVGASNTKMAAAGGGEAVQEWAAVLGTMVDGIVARVHAHDELTQMARWAGVPVINALCDRYHPCQGLADAMTAYQAHAQAGETLEAFFARPQRWTYVGDGNNVTHSLLLTAASLGVQMHIACPEGHGVDMAIVGLARALHPGGASQIVLTTDASAAVEGADLVYTDTWESYGQEGKLEGVEARAAFTGYCVDEALMGLAKPEAVFLHCLPAYPGQEVSEGVLRGTQSRVIQQAENRLWTTQSVLAHVFADPADSGAWATLAS